ncbi:MAG: FecR domain-containing protein [Tannerellaceae bacterium]|nr:FecR domain-containing protein [Tannerellaceae bacterium]
MAEEMREDIYLELNQRIQYSIRRVFYLKIVAVAASFILLVGFSSYISYHEGYKKQHSQTVTVVNPLGLQSSFVLPDGTAVLLNAGTTLSYPSAFIAKSREVIIEGEAFFEVAHDAAHPFIVKAENVRVQVLGTKFNVKAYKEEGNIEVTLEEGSVGVRLAHQSDLIRITPGEQICFSKVAQKFVRREVNPELYMAWRERAFHFNNVTFDNIARQLERRFNVNVEIATEDLKKIRFTGDFVRDENLLQILQVITTDKRMVYEVDKEDNNKIRIYNRNTD